MNSNINPTFLKTSFNKIFNPYFYFSFFECQKNKMYFFQYCSLKITKKKRINSKKSSVKDLITKRSRNVHYTLKVKNKLRKKNLVLQANQFKLCNLKYFKFNIIKNYQYSLLKQFWLNVNAKKPHVKKSGKDIQKLLLIFKKYEKVFKNYRDLTLKNKKKLVSFLKQDITPLKKKAQTRKAIKTLMTKLRLKSQYLKKLRFRLNKHNRTRYHRKVKLTIKKLKIGYFFKSVLFYFFCKQNNILKQHREMLGVNFKLNLNFKWMTEILFSWYFSKNIYPIKLKNRRVFLCNLIQTGYLISQYKESSNYNIKQKFKFRKKHQNYYDIFFFKFLLNFIFLPKFKAQTSKATAGTFVLPTTFTYFFLTKLVTYSFNLKNIKSHFLVENLFNNFESLQEKNFKKKKYKLDLTLYIFFFFSKNKRYLFKKYPPIYIKILSTFLQSFQKNDFFRKEIITRQHKQKFNRLMFKPFNRRKDRLNAFHQVLKKKNLKAFKLQYNKKQSKKKKKKTINTSLQLKKVKAVLYQKNFRIDLRRKKLKVLNRSNLRIRNRLLNLKRKIHFKLIEQILRLKGHGLAIKRKFLKKIDQKKKNKKTNFPQQQRIKKLVIEKAQTLKKKKNYFFITRINETLHKQDEMFLVRNQKKKQNKSRLLKRLNFQINFFNFLINILIVHQYQNINQTILNKIPKQIQKRLFNSAISKHDLVNFYIYFFIKRQKHVSTLTKFLTFISTLNSKSYLMYRLLNNVFFKIKKTLKLTLKSVLYIEIRQKKKKKLFFKTNLAQILQKKIYFYILYHIFYGFRKPTFSTWKLCPLPSYYLSKNFFTCNIPFFNLLKMKKLPPKRSCHNVMLQLTSSLKKNIKSAKKQVLQYNYILLNFVFYKKISNYFMKHGKTYTIEKKLIFILRCLKFLFISGQKPTFLLLFLFDKLKLKFEFRIVKSGKGVFISPHVIRNNLRKIYMGIVLFKQSLREYKTKIYNLENKILYELLQNFLKKGFTHREQRKYFGIANKNRRYSHFRWI